MIKIAVLDLIRSNDRLANLYLFGRIGCVLQLCKDFGKYDGMLGFVYQKCRARYKQTWKKERWDGKRVNDRKYGREGMKTITGKK